MAGFKEIIGHEQLIDHLKAALIHDRVSHAYILEGEEKSGKMMIARAFAQSLECEAGGEEACGECVSCKQMASGNHPDVKFVSHEKTAAISVDDIRTQINADVAVRPYAGRYKIYIVDEAEKMNEQAQNALLKTIEEPPAYGIILLLTSNLSRLLPTILSRCTVLHLKPVSDEKIIGLLTTKYQIPDYRAKTCAAFAKGNVGQAISMAASDDFSELLQRVLHMAKTIDEREVYEISTWAKEISADKETPFRIIDMLLTWYRDVLVMKASKDEALVVYKDEVYALKRQAEAYSYESLQRIFEMLEETRRRLSSNVNAEVSLEMMLLAMKEN